MVRNRDLFRSVSPIFLLSSSPVNGGHPPPPESVGYRVKSAADTHDRGILVDSSELSWTIGEMFGCHRVAARIYRWVPFMCAKSSLTFRPMFTPFPSGKTCSSGVSCLWSCSNAGAGCTPSPLGPALVVWDGECANSPRGKWRNTHLLNLQGSKFLTPADGLR